MQHGKKFNPRCIESIYNEYNLDINDRFGCCNYILEMEGEELQYKMRRETSVHSGRMIH